jgi:molybdate transport system ATP-binding protein
MHPYKINRTLFKKEDLIYLSFFVYFLVIYSVMICVKINTVLVALHMKYLVRLQSCTYSVSGSILLLPLSLTVYEGNCIRIAGKNGSGKTTLLRILKGEINPDDGIADSRSYNFNNEESHSPIHAQKYVRLISPALQNRYRKYGWNITGFECIATGFDDTALLYRDLEEHETTSVNRLIEQFNLAELKNKSMLRMSRGEARQILLARAIISKPALLLLDEYLHEIDPESRVRLSSILSDIHTSGITIVYTTHIEDEILSDTTSTVILDKPGSGTVPLYPQIFENIFSETYKNKGDMVYTLADCSVYLHESRVLKNISFTMNDNQNWVIIGSNGSGKSTFIKLLYGLVRPAFGSIINRHGQTVDESVEEIIKRTGYLSSELQCVYDGDVVCTDVIASSFTSSIGIYRPVTEVEKNKAVHLMSACGLLSLADREFQTLSYGEQRKILFLRSIAANPHVLLLDEPLTGIDTLSRGWMVEAIEHISSACCPLIIAVHHREDIPRNATHLLYLEKGEISYSGRIGDYPLEEYFSNGN